MITHEHRLRSWRPCLTSEMEYLPHAVAHSPAMLGLLQAGGAGAQRRGHGEAMRYAARHSGRISFLAYLLSMLVFTRCLAGRVNRDTAVHTALLFAWLHLLHFGYLATNLSMSAITPEPVKVAGGALAYGMILTHPLWVRRVQPRHGWHVVHYLRGPHDAHPPA